MDITMNLFDLVKRPDRAVEIVRGDVEAVQGQVAGISRRYVRLGAGSAVQIRGAQEMSALKILSSDLGWSALAESRGTAKLNVSLLSPQGRSVSVVVAELANVRADTPEQLEFRWPIYMASLASYDIVVSNIGAVPIKLLVGPAIDMRSYVLPYAVGTGVEVGPGLRPHVLPSDITDVSYVEQQDPREWLKVYNHSAEKPPMPPDDVLGRYRIGTAVELETVPAGTLDFVFSNHVFEHLANPVQVMKNWLSRLKPGGAILGVIPDPRYTFDCRQPPTTLDEVVVEEQLGGHEIARSKYVRWCQFTEPRHTPEGLIGRGYSIHVNYFTPEGFKGLADLLEGRGLISRSFLATAPNNKDFAFAMWKGGVDAAGFTSRSDSGVGDALATIYA